MTTAERIKLITEILHFLPNFKNNLSERKRLLKWDSDEILYTIKIEDLMRAVYLFDKGSISKEDIEEWANFIECREDLDFASEDLKDAIYDAANPTLSGENPVERLRRLSQ